MNQITKIEVAYDCDHDWESAHGFVESTYPIEYSLLDVPGDDDFHFVFYTIKPELMLELIKGPQCPVEELNVVKCTPEEYLRAKERVEEEMGEEEENLLEYTEDK